MAALQFELVKESDKGSSRAGTITTDHGTIQTPIFMPVGTIGSVKAVTQQQLKQDIQAQIILGNTYHLYLRPGLEVLEAAGGLHQFMGWDRPILTDSGGYQVFSLANNRKIKPEGVIFQSHIDGSKHLFSPEKVMDIQRTIGADIIMAFDECPPIPSTYEYVRKSMDLTHTWLDKCVHRLAETPDKYGYTQNLFPIVQGGLYKDLRKASCEYISSKNAVGNAIGGLSVGETQEEMYEFTALCCENLPKDKPRYLMGVGTPWNILEAIDLGIDMFDCVMPTRNGRNGMIFTSQGVINIKNKQWASDFTPLDPGIPNELSNYYTKAYMRHLFVADEILGLQLASIQNLSFYLWLVGQAREHIIAGDYSSWKTSMIQQISKRL
ncbi:MAG: tRNA guanosine(34) transglycosylase Tgt [Bacteroidota bacterium]|jgi:queuine tRNA-ribosyltransferase